MTSDSSNGDAWIACVAENTPSDEVAWSITACSTVVSEGPSSAMNASLQVAHCSRCADVGVVVQRVPLLPICGPIPLPPQAIQLSRLASIAVLMPFPKPTPYSVADDAT